MRPRPQCWGRWVPVRTDRSLRGERSRFSVPRGARPQGSKFRPQGGGEQNLVRSEPGSVWTEAWPPWGLEPTLSEEWSRASLRTIAGPQCRAERSRVSLRTGAHPLCGVEPGLGAEWRLASEKQSLASRRTRAGPQRSKVRSQGGTELNRSEKRARPQ